MKGNKCCVCSKDSSLRCTGCKVAYYCGRECQAKDREKHKDICKSIKKLTDTVHTEKAALRDLPDVNLFSDVAVNFWEHREARPYMQARVYLFKLLDDIGTEFALKEAIIQGKDMIKEGRGIHPDVRHTIPSVYLRLSDPNALQECYDFMKWGCIHKDNYDQEMACQNRQSDMCEPMYSLHGVDLYNIVALTLVKMRLLVQIEQFLTEFDLLLNATIRPSSSSHIIGGNPGVLISVTSFLLPHHACFTNKKIAQLRVLRTKLSDQVQTLLNFAESAYDRRIWKILVNPLQLQEQVQSLRFPSRFTIRFLTVAFCYFPFFSTETKQTRAMRQLLVDRVGEAPDYKLTIVQGTVCVVTLP